MSPLSSCLDPFISRRTASTGAHASRVMTTRTKCSRYVSPSEQKKILEIPLFCVRGRTFSDVMSTETYSMSSHGSLRCLLQSCRTSPSPVPGFLFRAAQSPKAMPQPDSVWIIIPPATHPHRSNSSMDASYLSFPLPTELRIRFPSSQAHTSSSPATRVSIRT